MANTGVASAALLRCDGCGQTASSEHISRRLQRLEWATRYRPVHIGTLFFGAIAPKRDADYLYATDGAFTGEAALVLEAAGISSSGRALEAMLAEFQRGGCFLVHAVECFTENSAEGVDVLRDIVQARVAPLLARVRRSLKPKRVVPISRLLEPMLDRLTPEVLSCAVVLDQGKPFALDGNEPRKIVGRLREVLGPAGLHGAR